MEIRESDLQPEGRGFESQVRQGFSASGRWVALWTRGAVKRGCRCKVQLPPPVRLQLLLEQHITQSGFL
ncbi:hypothetical protein PGIGA_G00259460 [Pangasianodon gigas]|uniref:Uncharacterized protein n=1 Tax=Pangasianodon gigas TaxID=30993 RepID=A0ACC5WT81_PANGG|nr:hypothetical protein [Pangasianodon gigas]